MAPEAIKGLEILNFFGIFELTAMARKRTGVRKNSNPPAEDDLTSIPGITPAIANCLREAGITSFEGLASVPAGETVAVLGPGFEVSAAVVARADWVGEASRLAAEAQAAREPARIRLREVEVNPMGNLQPSRLIESARPYRVRIVADVTVDPGEETRYSLFVGARSAQRRRVRAVASSEGAVFMAPILTFDLAGAPLPPGRHALFVVMRLGPDAVMVSGAGVLDVL